MESELVVDERDLAGTRWRVVRVRFEGRQHATEFANGAWLRFAAAREFFAYDGVNWLSGRWQATGGHLTFTDVITTLRGYAGNDASMKALIGAARSVFLRAATPLRYSVSAEVLTLVTLDAEIDAQAVPSAEDAC